jgi:hypothetical protein
VKLPNAHLAIVSLPKLSEYLLNSSHPDNGGKAAFFLSLGFRADDPEVLAFALRQIATSGVTEKLESSHGTKYIIEAQIDSPSGKSPWVRTVWIIDRDQSAPGLVTAYPADKRNYDEGT